MNLFEKAKRNAILKMKYKRCIGIDINELIRELEEDQKKKDNKTIIKNKGVLDRELI